MELNVQNLVTFVTFAISLKTVVSKHETYKGGYWTLDIHHIGHIGHIGHIRHIGHIQLKGSKLFFLNIKHTRAGTGHWTFITLGTLVTLGTFSTLVTFGTFNLKA